MAFLRSSTPMDASPLVRGDGVWLRPPTQDDYAQWASLRAISRQHLVPFEPKWTRDELSRASFRHRLRHYQRELREDTGYALFIFSQDTDELLGGLTLSNVRRGVTQAASVGYWIGAPYAGRGYMSAAVGAIIPFAFDVLGLHRLEAACLPDNHVSMRVLEKAGFQREGLARRYLKIDGVWSDHLLFAIVEDDRRL